MQNECTAKAEGNQLYTTELIWQKKKIEVFAIGVTSQTLYLPI